MSNDKLDPQVRFMAEVYAERRHQDAQWGGPEHDDQQSLNDWLNYLDYQTNLAYTEFSFEEFPRRNSVVVWSKSLHSRWLQPNPWKGRIMANTEMRRCSYDLRTNGRPYPRTCMVCGLGPCKYSLQEVVTGEVKALQPPPPPVYPPETPVETLELSQSFANMPKSITELKAEKNRRGADRTVRDMLVDILRRIDSGEPEYQNISLGMVIIRCVENDAYYTQWHCGGHDFDELKGIGLLAKTLHDFQER